MSLSRVCLLPLLLLTLAAEAAPPARVERGNLVIEGIPEIPPALAERMNQYQQTRAASLQGWLPDGSLLITTRFGETAQVHRVRQPLGMREQLTFFPEPVAEAAPAPDGQGFLYAKDVGGNEFYQIHAYDFANGRSTLLTDGTSRNTGAIWSRKGTQYAFTTTRRNGKDSDIHVAGLKGGPSRALVEREGSWAVLDWSPDDRRLLVMRYISITESELHLVDVASGSISRFHPTATPVSFSAAAFAADGGIWYVSDEGAEFQQLRYERADGSGARVVSAGTAWDVDGLALSRDGRWLAYTINADGFSELRVLDTRRGQPLKLPSLPRGVIGDLHFDTAGARLGFVFNGARSAGDVYAIELKDQRLVRWTRSETGGLDASRFVEPQLVRFESFDGRSIPSFYYRPEGTGPHPVIINIHGGPEAQSLPTFSPITEFYVRELGAAVLLPNVRGSAGYGKSYLALDNGFQREDSVKDIGALLDWIAKQPELDARRVLVMGGSYGGYMTLAAMTHYNARLRAGIDVVGISNFVTFLTNTQDYRRDLRRVEYGDERDPAMRAHLEKISPTTNAARISKPLFVVQGANDPRVPASEAEQMVATVRKQGGEVWYLLAKDEGHGFRKKANRDYYLNAVTLFLQKHLLAPEVP